MSLIGRQKKTRFSPGFNLHTMPWLHTMFIACRTLLFDQCIEPPRRVIVSTCPPSILAFKLICGRTTDRLRSVAADLMSVGRWRRLFFFSCRMRYEYSFLTMSSMTKAPNFPGMFLQNGGGSAGALIGQRGAGPRLLPLTATRQLVTSTVYIQESSQN